MNGWLKWWGAAVVAATVMVACGDGITGPVGGEVVALTRIGEQTLPVAIEEAPGYVRLYRADTIHLGDNDRWSRRTVQDFTRPGAELLLVDAQSEGTVEYFGGEIILSFVCDDTADCIAPDRLIPETMGYRMERWVTQDSVLVLRYELVMGEGS
jgi:hypothetical protein